MSDIRAGALIRAARQRRGLRQLDLAEATGVSQQTVSLIERGHLDRLGLATVRAVAAFVEVDLPLAPRYRGAEGDRLLDAGHARIVDALVDLLGRHGWQTIVEYSFSHFGERGSVDVVGWRAAQRALLIVEVKTELVDVQQTLRSMSIKERVVPPLLARDHGWRARSSGLVLVLPDERGRRSAVERHGAIFRTALPSRTVDCKRWIDDPTQTLRGVWFLHLTNGRGGKHGRVVQKRVRRPKSAPTVPGPRSVRAPAARVGSRTAPVPAVSRA